MSEPVVLAPKLDLAAASALLTSLRSHDAPELVIDMSQVKHLGALCLQVLLAAAKTSNSQNRTMTLSSGNMLCFTHRRQEEFIYGGAMQRLCVDI